jgi:hypothetical protein
MKNVRLIMLVSLVFFLGCRIEGPRKYVPSTARAREKYATPEPGTYLRPMAYALLKEINKRLLEPEKYKEPGNMVKEMFSTRQKRLLDTLVSHDGLEVPVRIYSPGKNSMKGGSPVMLFIHGGGLPSRPGAPVPSRVG